MRDRWLVPVVVVAALGGCGDDAPTVGAATSDPRLVGVPATQVMVVAEPDAQLRPHIVSVDLTLHAGAPDAASWPVRHQQSFDMLQYDWPLRVAVLPEGGDASRQFQVTLEARDDAGELVVVVSARTGFVRDDIRELPLDMVASCQNRFGCGAGMTCATSGCVSAAVDVNSLSTY